MVSAFPHSIRIVRYIIDTTETVTFYGKHALAIYPYVYTPMLNKATTVHAEPPIK